MTVYVTITPVDVAQAVADEINLPANLAIWSQSGFGCAMTFLPIYDKDTLSTLQIGVVPVQRRRERGTQGVVPAGQRVGQGSSRSVLQSEHVVNVEMYQYVDPAPATYAGQLKALISFLYQVDDYFMAKHRRLASVAGSAANNVYCTGAKTTNCSPDDLEKDHLWRGGIQLTFQEQTAW